MENTGIMQLNLPGMIKVAVINTITSPKRAFMRQAAMLAEEALPLARTMRSHVNLERIKLLYQQFQNTPFRNNPEVGRLGYLLFHP